MTPLLLNWAVQGAVLALAAAATVRIVPAGAAAQRHQLWWFAFVAVAVLPPLAWCWPVAAVVAGASAAAGVPALSGVGGQGLVLPAPPGGLDRLLAVAWAGVSTVLLVRLAADIAAMHRLVRRAVALDTGAVSARRLADTGRRLGLASPADLRVSTDVRAACAAGLLRSSILVSSRLAETLDDEALEAVVAHERAHVQRRDVQTRAVQRLVLALLWWHPALWWVSRNIDVEAESACDQRVLSGVPSALAYAGALARAASLATASWRAPEPRAVAGASLSSHAFLARIARLVNQVPVTRRGAWGRGATGALALSLVAGVVVVSPPLVALQGPVAEARMLAALAVPDRVVPELRVASRRLLVVHPSAVAAVRTGPPQSVSDSLVDLNVVPVRGMAVAAPEMLEVGRPLTAVIEGGEVPARALPAQDGPGAAAARAGTSIGRFFRRGGIAVAQTLTYR